MRLKWDTSRYKKQNLNAKNCTHSSGLKKYSNKLIRACENNLVLHVCPSMVQFLCFGYYTTLAFIFLYFMPPWIYVIVIAFCDPDKIHPPLQNHCFNKQRKRKQSLQNVKIDFLHVSCLQTFLFFLIKTRLWSGHFELDIF